MEQMRMIRATLFLLLAPVGAAMAQAPDPFARCDGLDNTARLACYDSVRNTMRTPSPTLTRPHQAAQAPRKFTRFTATITNYTLNPAGKFTITLDNGQIWRQFDADDSRAKFRANGRNVVTVTRGFWGSYNLNINDLSAVFKAERIR